MRGPFKDFCGVYFALCKNVNTPYALACYIAWTNRCFTQLSAPRPELYDSKTVFERDYLVYAWASKAQYNLEKLDLSEIALVGFISDEHFNMGTDIRIRRWLAGESLPRLVEESLPVIQRKIAAVLGPCKWARVLSGCRFGNGASVSLSRAQARFDKKMTTLPLTVSPDACEIALTCIESDPVWASALLGQEVDGPFCISKPGDFIQLTDYNLFDTVPKSLKTDRTIAKEPVLNGFLQQGVHTYMRRRLHAAGVNLSDQGINQGFASLAQKLDLATLDAKSASNSVTTALVELLLPHDWFVFLDILRSRRTLLPNGELHDNVMFSSMGNAFTFELESLIFWAILSAVCPPKSVVSVYGDDMICPQRCAEDVISVLEELGFRINKEKSFTSGRFFESCGKHYYDSKEVTPVYQKKAPRSSDPERVRAANRLVRWALRSAGDLDLMDSTVRAAYELLSRDAKAPRGPVLRVDRDDFLQTPGLPIRIEHDVVVGLTGLLPVSERQRTRQKAAYAYWLRLRSPDRSVESRVKNLYFSGITFPRSYPLLAKSVQRTIDSGLELSEVGQGEIWRIREVRQLREECRVDARWMN